MEQVLDEFYRNITAVAVSAVTGTLYILSIYGYSLYTLYIRVLSIDSLYTGTLYISALRHKA
jgi:hypothetical protein